MSASGNEAIRMSWLRWCARDETKIKYKHCFFHHRRHRRCRCRRPCTRGSLHRSHLICQFMFMFFFGFYVLLFIFSHIYIFLSFPKCTPFVFCFVFELRLFYGFCSTLSTKIWCGFMCVAVDVTTLGYKKNTRKISLFSTASIYFVCFTLYCFE